MSLDVVEFDCEKSQRHRLYNILDGITVHATGSSQRQDKRGVHFWNVHFPLSNYSIWLFCEGLSLLWSYFFLSSPQSRILPFACFFTSMLGGPVNSFTSGEAAFSAADTYFCHLWIPFALLALQPIPIPTQRAQIPCIPL